MDEIREPYVHRQCCFSLFSLSSRYADRKSDVQPPAHHLLSPDATGRKAAKKRCVACEIIGKEMTREHVWPEWLIDRAQLGNSRLRWFEGKRISANASTIPLCRDCNNKFGSVLEAPVSNAFEALEGGRGLSDLEAELLVRWMWKFEGYSWLLSDQIRTYSHITTLRARVLNPLGTYRPRVALAISLIDAIDPTFGDRPVGLDSENRFNCIFVAGVFSKIAIVVLLRQFAGLLPSAYSVYYFADKPDPALESARLFYPKTGFANDVEAVAASIRLSKVLVQLHDDCATRSTDH
jgi:hypothetical protein